MTDGARIRMARAEEGREVLALIAAIDAETTWLLREPGESPRWRVGGDPAADLGAFLARSNCAMLVAEREGRLVGVLGATGGRCLRNRGVATLKLAVLSAHHGRGIGPRLLEAAVAWGRAVGLHRLELTVSLGNDRAYALYRRFGFEDEGVERHGMRVGGVWRDERLMGKWIGPDPRTIREWPPVTLDALPPAPIDGLVVREAGPEDAAAYFACDRAVREETPFLLRTAAESLPDATAARRFLAGQRAGGGEASLIAVLDRDAVGILALWTGAYARIAHEASLGLAVRREYWGSGVGKRLMAAGEAWARARGLHRFSLWVLGHNTRARRFYASCGFAEEAVARRYALIDGAFADHVLMAKLLD